MSEIDESLDNIVILTDANGDECRMEFLDLIHYRAKDYAVFLPVDDDGNDVVIMQVDDTPGGDEEAYLAVEDDSIVQAVFEIFKEQNKEYFNFTDDGPTKTVGGKKMKVRARLGVLFMAWIGAWIGLHFHWMGYHEAAVEWRRKLGGIFALLNPVAWILHAVEIFKVLFGAYRTDAYGRPIRYFAPFRKVK
jgi:uncharacterized protein YrzB (UPF0473 family)